MGLKVRIRFNPQARKKLPGIAAAAIIGRKHFQRHGLAETARPAEADKFLLGIKEPAGTGNQSRFIHIDIGTDGFPEALVSRI